MDFFDNLLFGSPNPDALDAVETADDSRPTPALSGSRVRGTSDDDGEKIPLATRPPRRRIIYLRDIHSIFPLETPLLAHISDALERYHNRLREHKESGLQTDYSHARQCSVVVLGTNIDPLNRHIPAHQPHPDMSPFSFNDLLLQCRWYGVRDFHKYQNTLKFADYKCPFHGSGCPDVDDCFFASERGGGRRNKEKEQCTCAVCDSGSQPVRLEDFLPDSTFSEKATLLWNSPLNLILFAGNTVSNSPSEAWQTRVHHERIKSINQAISQRTMETGGYSFDGCEVIKVVARM